MAIAYWYKKKATNFILQINGTVSIWNQQSHICSSCKSRDSQRDYEERRMQYRTDVRIHINSPPERDHSELNNTEKRSETADKTASNWELKIRDLKEYSFKRGSTGKVQLLGEKKTTWERKSPYQLSIYFPLAPNPSFLALLCFTEARPCKHVTFVSWHDIKLYQQKVLE